MHITFRAILFEHDLGTTLSTVTKIFTWMNYYNYSNIAILENSVSLSHTFR